MSASVRLTSRADELTPELLTAIVRTRYPDVTVSGVDVLSSRTYGEGMVSTAGRVMLNLQFAPGAPAGLPQRVMLKVAVGGPHVSTDYLRAVSALYENEVQVYRHLGAEIEGVAPRSLGGLFDPESMQFGLLLEDLSLRGVRFPNVLDSPPLSAVEALVDRLAQLHARYWESPRFGQDLKWVQTHLAGGVERLMNQLAPPMIHHEIDTVSFKREMVQRLRTTGPEMLAGVKALQLHQSRLPQTLLHGDTHLGNTYLLPDGGVGLVDWQLSVRGHCMHDVSYLLVTSQSIAARRENERALLARYREQLLAAGVKNPPSAEQIWNEYRRALVWGVYIGWLTTPVVNYGWEINVMNHLRLTTAYEDLDTARLVKEVMQ
jgi:hypothetical protein